MKVILSIWQNQIRRIFFHIFQITTGFCKNSDTKPAQIFFIRFVYNRGTNLQSYICGYKQRLMLRHMHHSGENENVLYATNKQLHASLVVVPVQKWKCGMCTSCTLQLGSGKRANFTIENQNKSRNTN